jgi:cysteine synthase B
LREQDKPVSIVGLQPEEGSSIPGIRRWPAEYMPGIFNASLVDAVLDIHQQDAENTMRMLAVREGIFAASAPAARWPAHYVSRVKIPAR